MAPDGRVASGRERERIDALAVPPAWTDVWVAWDADAHLQATGRDDAGRKQYRYHDRWREVRDSLKFERLAGFAENLPDVRAEVAGRLQGRRLSESPIVVPVPPRTRRRPGPQRVHPRRGLTAGDGSG